MRRSPEEIKMAKKILILVVIVISGLFMNLDVSGKELKKIKIIASSVENSDPNLKPENVIDDNMATRWSSEFSDPQWIYIDFGEPKTFNTITLNWETAYGKQYEIQISDDAADWTTIYTEMDGDGNLDVISAGNQTARYIRMYGTQRAAEWGYSLCEIKIYNDSLPPSIPTNLSAVFSDKIAFLDWNDNSETDLFGYNLYRAKNSEDPYNRVNLSPLKFSRFKDKNLTKDIIYYYLVKAIDCSGNESSPSKKISGGLSCGETENYFSIPSCAWQRYLGDIPEEALSSSPNRGVALGGFGASSFMYNISGSFGPWELKICDSRFEQFWKSLPQAAFHYYEKGKDEHRPLAKTLSTDTNLKSSWDKIKAGEAKYFALQPKGWVIYNSFTAKIKSLFYSPIIAHNYKETSYPVAVFEYELYNPTQEKIEVALMLTWPQVPYSTLPRKGYQTHLMKKGDISGVVLKAFHPENTAETQNSEWCIAAKKIKGDEVISYVLSWDKDGSGQDIWNDFSDDGMLSNESLDSSNSAIAMAVKVILNPFERRRIPFVISWDIPVVEFASGTQWWRKYTEYFGRDSDNSFDIAIEALNNYQEWEKKIGQWMNPVIENPKYPDWLKCAAFNELYYNQFGGVFYEAGLKSGHKKEFMGLHQDDHKHFVMESPIYRSANTLDVRHYSSIVFAKFWPEIEKDTLKSYADATLHYKYERPLPKGLVPHDVGDPTKWDPYFKFDVYRHDIPNLPYWKDLHSKFIQQCWRYYYLYKDKEFLGYVWPACKATYNFMKTTDTDRDFLPNNHKSDNTYDDWGLYGTSLLCGGLWVGALESMEKMAEIMDDPIFEEIKTWLKKAKPELDKQLWHKKCGYYKIDTGSKFPTAIMADGLNGQRYCEAYGLDNILPAKRMKSHLKQVYERCVKPMQDYTGDGIGDIGAINGLKEDGSLLNTLQSDEVWTGSTYFLAASMYHAGLKKEALQTAFGVYYITYKEESTAFWFNTPESWRIPTMKPRPDNPEQYQRPRAIWELVLEIE